MITKKKLKKFGGEILFTIIILTGLIGIFYTLWFVDVHTFEITITRESRGPF